LSSISTSEPSGAIASRSIRPPWVVGDLLPVDQHPFAGQNVRLTDGHRFELLLAGRLATGQEGRLIADAPDRVLDGHRGRHQPLGQSSIRQANFLF
jgi:hypothetical protein